MAFVERAKFKLIFLNLGDNKIGNEGCAFVSKSDWPSMKRIDLYQNLIDSKGVMHLRRANWPLL